MSTTEELQLRIDTEDDFVNIKRLDYSLERVLQRYPDGAPQRVIAQALMISEDEVEKLYETVVQKLRNALKVEVQS